MGLLARLAASLLDVSRLQAGALPVVPYPADLGQIITRSLGDLGSLAHAIMVDIPPGLPPVMADPAIMERVIANVTANALRYSADRSPPLLTASARGDRIELRVADHGPGIPRPTETGCSRPSSGSATPVTAPASGSASPSPVA